jgi:hypothetical protein
MTVTDIRKISLRKGTPPRGPREIAFQHSIIIEWVSDDRQVAGIKHEVLLCLGSFDCAFWIGR